MFDSVIASATGRRVRAKKLPTRLKLPPRLRIQSVGGRKTTSRTPAALAIRAVPTNMIETRTRAMTSQSQRGPRACVVAPIAAKQKAPPSIQRAGRPLGSVMNQVAGGGWQGSRVDFGEDPIVAGGPGSRKGDPAPGTSRLEAHRHTERVEVRRAG